jgi:molecular chaperone GrpE
LNWKLWNMSNDSSTEPPGGPADDPTDPSLADASPEEQLASLKTKAAKADENWERLLRLSADFENFKKRAARERDEVRRSTTESVLNRLLPVLDNFDMALAAADQPGTSVETLKEGVGMIHGQLRAAANGFGLEEINAVGQAFDPSLHEAVSQQESADVPEGHVVQQLRKGYRLRDRLLRPASVVVARKPSAPSA